jgi:hypothetical protein
MVVLAAVSASSLTIWMTSGTLIFFDRPLRDGYQSMNAVFAADMLYVPSGPVLGMATAPRHHRPGPG